MSSDIIRQVADAVLRRAQSQGFVLESEILEELARAGLAGASCEPVLSLLGSALRPEILCYQYAGPVGPKPDPPPGLQSVRELIRRYQATLPTQERREQGRIDLIQPVKVRTSDGQERTLLTRDLSPAGIRLISTHSLLGEKLLILLPRPGGEGALAVTARILWASRVADEQFESGGVFLEPHPSQDGLEMMNDE
jgi:hypothetical protein